MGGAKEVAQVVVVVGMLILVSHQETDGTAGGFSFKNAGKNLHFVSFLARRRQSALTGAATVKL